MISDRLRAGVRNMGRAAQSGLEALSCDTFSRFSTRAVEAERRRWARLRIVRSVIDPLEISNRDTN